MKLFSPVIKFFKSKIHPLIKALIVVLFLLIVVNGAYYFVSAYSKGCLICHYMKPYYEQSVNSTHKNISCVTCHPGRRLLTAPYLLRYIAGSYNPRPRAEVDDHICLDCHKEQNLKKRTVFAMNISFNHIDHLSDLKRGKKLRCTSCHARGEKEHFKVDRNVCYTCHFKGATKGHSVTNCNVCHGNPKKIVEHGGFQFDHDSYLKIGVECAQCHINVVSGDAEVEKTKCYKCHVERLEEYSNIDKIHNTHITSEGVDCEECHNAIQHGKIKMISSLEANCENCHQLRHSPQRQMYIGSEGKGVMSTPSRMFAAQVSCEGCHLDLNKDGKSDLNEKREACKKCHGNGYDLMLDKWISSINEAVNSLKGDLEYASGLVENSKADKLVLEAEKNYLSDAWSNYNLVKDGRGVHNIDYALKLLQNVSSNIEGIISRLGNKTYKSNHSKLLSDDNEFCNLCHFVITPKNTERFQDVEFPHNRHMQSVKCTACHSKTEHKKLIINKDNCDGCHKNISNMPVNIKYGLINFPHTLHAKSKGIDCSTCHTSTDFTKAQIKKNICTSCHHKQKELRKNCAKCHLLQSNIYDGLIAGKKLEPDIMKSNGVDCEGCHVHSNDMVSKPKQSFCAECHDASYKDMQTEWLNDIKLKSSELSSFIKQVENSSMYNDNKVKVLEAKKLINAVKSDKSNGMHNYMSFSSELNRYLKEMKSLIDIKK